MLAVADTGPSQPQELVGQRCGSLRGRGPLVCFTRLHPWSRFETYAYVFLYITALPINKSRWLWKLTILISLPARRGCITLIEASCEDSIDQLITWKELFQFMLFKSCLSYYLIWSEQDEKLKDFSLAFKTCKVLCSIASHFEHPFTPVKTVLQQDDSVLHLLGKVVNNFTESKGIRKSGLFYCLQKCWKYCVWTMYGKSIHHPQWTIEGFLFSQGTIPQADWKILLRVSSLSFSHSIEDGSLWAHHLCNSDDEIFITS